MVLHGFTMFNVAPCGCMWSYVVLCRFLNFHGVYVVIHGFILFDVASCGSKLFYLA